MKEGVAGPGTVLVLDYVPENLESVRTTLQSSGYIVLSANKVEVALGLAREKKPDLLLCELHMRPFSGLDFLKRAKTDPALQGIPVVIISSRAKGTHDEIECLKCGAVNFLRRPIEPKALRAEIAAVLRNTKKNRPSADRN
jgi:DNA-binding response OmpR family regulator